MCFQVYLCAMENINIYLVHVSSTKPQLTTKKEPFFSIKMDLIIDFFKLGFLIISYRRRFCFFSLHHLFFRFLETTKTSPNSLKNIN